MMRDTSVKPTRCGLFGSVVVAAIGAALLWGGAPALAKSKPAAKDAGAASESPADSSADSHGKAAKADSHGKADPHAKADPHSKADPHNKKPAGKKSGKEAAAKPELLGSFGDWNAFSVEGNTCYALGSPKERQPKAKLKDSQAYVFISTRPGEGVKNEVAVNLGYPAKDNGSASADVDGDSFELVTKGNNAWVKNTAKEKEFVESLKSGTKLVVKASSAKGASTTDTYSLKGLSEALARVQQECK
jgi:hypothetical protein